MSAQEPDRSRDEDATHGFDRRTFLACVSTAGLSGTLFPGVLWAAMEQAGALTREVVRNAELVAGLEFTDQERDLMLEVLKRNRSWFKQIREVPLPNAVAPAFSFDPMLPGMRYPSGPGSFRMSRAAGVERPANLEVAAFWPVTRLSELIRTRQVRSVELTEMYLGRLRRHGPRLESVITMTEDLAMRQARKADEELARGHYRGPLHGIPWGAKDLLATRGYRTTWGANTHETQMLDEDATVVRRLEDAGAVLVAKLTLGALALSNVWFGGQTRNPWNPQQGSGGSSAGSAASVVAGLVGFAIGSETLGSIIIPSARCGASGLRPTFGRVSRAGSMTLSWTMDKLGPMCRSAEDCALVLNAIHGADGLDPTARTVPFNWDAGRDLAELRIGYFRRAFEEDHPGKTHDDHVLSVFATLGIPLIPIELPTQYPLEALEFILEVEGAAAFDDLTRSNRDDLLTRQTPQAWPNIFRSARLIPAVEYIQANRVRTMIMGAMEAALEGIDVFLTPTFWGGTDGGVLMITNLAGHPGVVVPNGLTQEGMPVSISFIGRLWGDADCLRVAKAFQDATEFHRRVPPLFAV